MDKKHLEKVEKMLDLKMENLWQKNEFENTLKKWRKIYIKADEIIQELFNRIEVDLRIKEVVLQDIPTNEDYKTDKEGLQCLNGK